MVREREKRKTYEELDRKKRKEQVKRHTWGSRRISVSSPLFDIPGVGSGDGNSSDLVVVSHSVQVV